MAKFRIGVLVGSIRKGSINQKLAEAVIKLGGKDFEFHQIGIGDLPIYNQDLDTDTPPESVARLRTDVRACDGVLFVTPEYNRTTTPLLLNALDWASRPYGHNAWAGKPAAMTGASGGAIGTAAAQKSLRDLFGVLDLRLVAQPEAYVQVKDTTFAPDGSIADEALRKILQKKMDKFGEWVAFVAAK